MKYSCRPGTQVRERHVTSLRIGTWALVCAQRALGKLHFRFKHVRVYISATEFDHRADSGHHRNVQISNFASLYHEQVKRQSNTARLISTAVRQSDVVVYVDVHDTNLFWSSKTLPCLFSACSRAHSYMEPYPNMHSYSPYSQFPNPVTRRILARLVLLKPLQAARCSLKHAPFV